MKYFISYENPDSHYINIEYIIENNQEDIVYFQLPSWRPGRYELGNFAKNIQKWAAFDEKGNPLKCKKITKDCWEVETKRSKSIHIKYNYYAAQLDAGACWLDSKQLYINGIHCFLYEPARRGEECLVQLHLPPDYKIACGMKQVDKNILHAKDYDELVDSPLICSSSLKYNFYSVEHIKFNIWFQGECKPDWEGLIKDFKLFSEEQLKMFKEFPASDYHFLIQILPIPFHHGVEHTNSTVLAFGPAYSFQNNLYKEFLGLASHELFHAWNIKTIRPAEMMPYDYTKENYSRLGYVAEGITTYYGDLILYRCGLFSDEDYFKTINKNLQRHFDNFGRFNMSVADSSFDTWLDGYSEGIPNRKVSIYTEGCLCALMIDLLIRKYTNNQKSLDDVMRILYYEFAKKNKGYSEEDYKNIIEEVAQTSFEEFFKDYYYGTASYKEKLIEVLNYIGCEIIEKPSRCCYEDRFGFKTINQNGIIKVSAVIPAAIAYMAGLTKDDEVIAINGIKLQSNLNEWCNYFQDETITITVNSQNFLKEIQLERGSERYYTQYSINKKSEADEARKQAFENWSNKSF